ncbi:MAG TPA: VWA domain-containing protein [Kineosporiaceae bacterium]|nr:VWA domain-containing protein [Kineosporiaceae bacterium]
MQRSLHRFVRLLRLRGVRVSVTEAHDAMRAAAQHGALDDRETLRCVLRVALVKDRRDEELFDELFDRYFRLEPVTAPPPGHGHGHEDLADDSAAGSFTLSPEPAQTPRQGHSHGKPADIRDFFRPEDLATAWNLHQEASKVDLAGMTDEIVLARERGRQAMAGPRLQLDTTRLHGAGPPGQLISSPGTRLDAGLTVAEEQALLGWLDDPDADVAAIPGPPGSGGEVAGLSELLKRHLAALAAMDRRAVESPGRHGPGTAATLGEAERNRLEETLRRLARTMPGALTHRRVAAGRGRVDPARTMRASMRFDGVPFRPVTVSRREDKPRLVVLADVSLSVRRTARFTLYFVHGLQRLFGQVRTFAFVAGPAEVTDLFAEHPAERALEKIFGGDVLDVDADSDYGTAFGRFREEFPDVVTRRTTVVILGDGRGNGHDPSVDVFEEIARRARQVIWLTPERRAMWRLGGCDLPRYAEFCDRVDVVRDLDGLDRATDDIAAGFRT